MKKRKFILIVESNLLTCDLVEEIEQKLKEFKAIAVPVA